MADYNPYANREVTKPLTNSDALISLVKVVLGTGILSMPLAFHHTGLVGGTILTLLAIFFIIYGMHLLVRCMVKASASNKVGYMTFPETMVYAFGEGPGWIRSFSKVSGYLVDIILCSSHYGVNVVYLVFVSVNLKQFLDHYHVMLDLRVIIAIVGLSLLPLFLLRELKYLVPGNLIATVLEILGILAILWYFFHGLGSIGDRELFPSSISDIPFAMGLAMFAVSSVGGMIAIESKMETPGDYISLLGILNIASIFFVLVFVTFGLIGYWRYGAACEASVTLNIPTDELLAQMIKLAIAFAVYLTYPLCGYVCIDIIFNHYVFKREVANPHRIEYIGRAIYLFVSTINAIAFPNLGPLLALVGAFSISLLNMIFPCMIELCLLYNGSYGRLKWILWKDLVFMLFGWAVFFYGTYSAIVSMISEYGGPSTQAASTDAESTTDAE